MKLGTIANVNSPDDFLLFKPDQDQINEALDIAELVKGMPGSVMKDERTPHGILSEIVTRDYYGFKMISWSKDGVDYDADLLTTTGQRIDVKTKTGNAIPKQNYKGGFFVTRGGDYSKVDVEFYFMARCFKDFSKLWLCGWTWKDEFFEKCSLLKKGEVDSEGFRAEADCYQLLYTEFYKFI